ncbi:MAG: UDP-N-acetylglucosamine--N-acetylmuramyl-(pentapeptide) pyrophosphoryl-undecaprenol N-acetylglucosamine transferase [Candidatus Pacebacteria bacterium]|nr:UDP-N-acetylglucosamine--N-acetylmuramyl-(pentapeptide) pyrophosphoryl-undecaprenol N-acetylglucosamine transferase [Candidatus Paceibacterota bacterium]
MKKRVKILLTGGGSGGHVYPLLAVAEKMGKIAIENGLVLDVRYFGARDFYSQVLEEGGIKISTVISSKIRRYFSLKNLLEPFRILLGLFQALWKIYWYMPDAAFSKGGPGALPVLLACKFYMIPIIIHESDSIPGLTNVISGKLAKRVFLGFKSAEEYFSKKDVSVVGNPVKAIITNQEVSEEYEKEAKSYFGLNPSEPVLLVMGGSQGATRINDFILENLSDLLVKFQILHQVGAANYESYKNEYSFLSKDWSDIQKSRYQFHGFFDKDLDKAYAAADMVLARAGAGTIFELAYMGRPSILVPLPEAANNHQFENARQYSEIGAAIVIEQENFKENIVVEQIIKLLGNKEILKKMGEAAKTFYIPNTAEIIAQKVLELAAS